MPPTDVKIRTDPSQDETLAELIHRAREGSPDAATELAERFRDYLLRLATRKMPKPLRSKLAPSDVLQEVFIEAWRDFSGFKGEDGRELLLWLRKILLHNLSDNVRRYYDTQKRQVSLEFRLEEYDLRRDEILSQGVLGLSPSAQAEAAEEKQRLETALALLPDPYRRVILLRNRDGLDFASIGDRMERSGEAARKLWANAVARLQCALERRHVKRPNKPR
jgi:RNA polymerase sigma-70 factor (ECF subfamily)